MKQTFTLILDELNRLSHKVTIPFSVDPASKEMALNFLMVHKKNITQTAVRNTTVCDYSY